ncbi:MAG: tripartite tricarboxylate transporter TctB family protein [Deltaproteobacteria bacterium]|nr:tripartite tricarboxylate transporter TctB family protein [Deltaproteobacteria bacterium]
MRRADIIVALGMMLVGFIAFADAIRLGFGWGISGPQAGFFPFYMGLGILICTIFIVIKAVKTYRKDGPGKPLIPEGGLTQILWILIPAIGVCLLTELIGLHLATIFYLAFNIRVLGKMSWVKVILLSVLVPLSMYIVFDKVFLIPLPLGLWGGSLIPF